MTNAPQRHGLALRGPRLTLRLGSLEDALAVAEFYRDNREHFRPTDPPRPPHFYTESFWVERLAASLLEYDDDRSCQLLLFHHAAPHDVAGYANLSNIVRGAFQACYLGYGIAAKYEGQGLMTEALRMCIRHAFETMNLHRIMANHLPNNERSARVLRRLGFVEEGYARRYLFINGDWRDHVLTSLTSEHWRAPNAAPRAAPPR